MTKTSTAKLKLPDGWTLLLTANKYQAQRKADGFTTDLVGEKVDAIKLAIKQEQEDQWNKSKARHVVEIPSRETQELQAQSDSEMQMIVARKERERDAATVVQQIPLSRIQPSPDNPRKHFDEAEMEELTASIRERGVDIPIAVLPARAFGMHTIIYGERRWRASQSAGKETIPALVLDITDERADEMRFNENHQRKNLTPLEEAAWFERRIKIYGKTVADIAAHSGYSTKTVTKRLRLNALPGVAKKALDEGTLCLGSALAIARLEDTKQMAEVAEMFTRATWMGYATDPKKAAQYIEQTYFTRLNKAPFKLGDVTLVPTAGSCFDCPKRSGNQSELFDDVTETDTCLDRKCYDSKCAAHVQRELDVAEAKGLKVLSEKEIKRIAPNGFINSDYVDLADQPWQDKKNRSWKQLLGKDAPEPVLAVVKGQIKRLVPKATAAEIIKAQHNISIELDRKSGSSSSAADDRRAQKIRQTVTKESLVALHAYALASFRDKLADGDLALWRALAAMTIDNLRNGAQDYMGKLLELEPKKNSFGSRDHKGALEAHLKELRTSAAVAAFVVQMLAADKLHWWTQPGGQNKPYDDHKAMCAAIGFDLMAAMKQAKAAASAKAPKAKGGL